MNRHNDIISPDGAEDSEVVPIPIDGILDLHTFRPSDVKELVPEYLQECRKRGILQVRIIHGKGMGVLRHTVHTVLDRTPGIVSYHTAGEEEGGWGAMILILGGPER